MDNEKIHPDLVLSTLLEKGCRRDKAATLLKLHELCAIEHKRRGIGARDLSIANMARVAESHGLFKARAIYNKQSEDYAELIRAWEAFSGPVASNAPKTKLLPDDKFAFLKKIDDPAVRSLCQMALIERDKLKAEINLLKSEKVWTIDMRPLGSGTKRGANDLAVIEISARLTDSERGALLAAIDPKALSQRKWSLGDHGEIQDEKGRCVFKPGFASAIHKVLGQD